MSDDYIDPDSGVEQQAEQEYIDNLIAAELHEAEMREVDRDREYFEERKAALKEESDQITKALEELKAAYDKEDARLWKRRREVWHDLALLDLPECIGKIRDHISKPCSRCDICHVTQECLTAAGAR